MTHAMLVQDVDGTWHKFDYKPHVTLADVQRWAAHLMDHGVRAYAEGDEVGEIAAKHGASPTYIETELNK